MHQILSKQKIFHYFMHMRAKTNMWILDLLIVSGASMFQIRSADEPE
eukprot:COSAG05_NODE_541_length_8832_cov_190.458491_12_plen_47_part_00